LPHRKRPRHSVSAAAPVAWRKRGRVSLEVMAHIVANPGGEYTRREKPTRGWCMKARTLANIARSGEWAVQLSLLRVAPPFYRSCFVASAFTHGVLQRLGEGPGAVRTARGRAGGEADRA